MKFRWPLFAFFAVGAAVLAIYFGQRHPHQSSPKRLAPSAAETIEARPTVPPDSLTLSRRLASASVNPAQQERAGEADPELVGVKELIRSYRAAVGENPVGTNAEITRALTGNNARKANFADSELKTKNGEIVDRWD